MALNSLDTVFPSSVDKYPKKIPRHLKQYLFLKADEVTSSKRSPVTLSIYQLTAVNWSRDRLSLHFETKVHDVGKKANEDPATYFYIF